MLVDDKRRQPPHAVQQVNGEFVNIMPSDAGVPASVPVIGAESADLLHVLITEYRSARVAVTTNVGNEKRRKSTSLPSALPGGARRYPRIRRDRASTQRHQRDRRHHQQSRESPINRRPWRAVQMAEATPKTASAQRRAGHRTQRKLEWPQSHCPSTADLRAAQVVNIWAPSIMKLPRSGSTHIRDRTHRNCRRRRRCTDRGIPDGAPAGADGTGGFRRRTPAKFTKSRLCRILTGACRWRCSVQYSRAARISRINDRAIIYRRPGARRRRGRKDRPSS